MLNALVARLKGLRWLVFLLCLFLLNGCFQYDLTLKFDHQLHGQIVQTLGLSDRAAAVARGTLAPWLNDLENRTRQLGGTISSPGYNQQVFTVPFSTSDDLVQRFDQLFADSPTVTDNFRASSAARDAVQVLTIPDLGQVTFHLNIDQTDWVFASRAHLIYDVDLQGLPGDSTAGSRGQAAGRSSAVGFQLQTPWGISQVLPGSAPPVLRLPNGAQWQLQPGRTYHIDVKFWVPSVVALGAVAIAGVVVLGYFLRYRLLRPARQTPSR